ncbi:MAG: diguanylate cyclase, partial [Rhizobiales bacterium]|nr:diguanylate cyclase [Hyphomicrobiales bacterium]
MSAPAQSNKLLRRAYVIALSLIAICSIASFAFLHASIDSMSNDAETLNISGKQRSLSQHAAHLIEDAHLAPSRAERQFSVDELEKVVREFAAVHKALIVGDAALGLAGKPSPAIRKMLFEPPVSADKLVSIFLGRVETVMEDLRAGRSDPRAARVLSELARVDITGAYNDIVAQYQREASDRVWRSKVIHFSILLITLALLAAEARFIFLPAVRSIETQTRRIQLSKAELDHAATHDALTGIANRRHALDTLQSSIDDVGEKGGNVAVLHLDLDGFKAVNDTLGHVAGDEALIQMAERLCSAVREADT